ncbi:MAM and LDL-receptor class A domain-containing protein 1-like [Patiria miniata]|uniref:MAM domain-containing protein n=1 Tax=Patiria miniata TaxID=46514 RepID=A0A913ZLP8_PATMI|nr:MAM and LDL-receptor class A domain-containing protein 1-like [Patiria miniata]
MGTSWLAIAGFVALLMCSCCVQLGLASVTAAPASVTTPQPTDWNCDFEQNICSYSQASGDDFDWTRDSGGTASQNTGPGIDHTKGDATGYYMYIETSSPRVQGDKARFESDIIPAVTSQRMCVTFWYHMYGDHIRDLNIYLKTGSGLGTAVWTRSGTRLNQWFRGDFSTAPSADFQVVFEGVVGSSFQGDIAIDDIVVTTGECPLRDFCEFQDSHLCGYLQDTTDDFDWLQNNGATPTANTGPSLDVSYDTTYGKYMYVEATGQSAGSVARLMTPLVPASPGVSRYCWYFSYHMYGDQMGTLNVNLNTTSVQQTLWTRSSNLGNLWSVGNVQVTSTLPYQLAFEGIVGTGDRSDIAIDDVGFYLGSCPYQENCDFETNTCLWTNDVTADNFDWLRLSGSTASSYTGPAVDHTTSGQNGFYMYTETSSPRVQGDRAIFKSPEIVPGANDPPICFTFWYHMFGVDIGALTISVVTEPNTANELATMNWLVNGQQSTDEYNWLNGQFDVSETLPFQIVFEGVVGASYQGDIAIDDIELVDGNCDTIPRSADPYLYVNNCTCDFEAFLCSWSQESADVFDWTLTTTSTPSSGTGPTGDHTGGGYYAYIETSSPRVLGDTARLISSDLYPTTPGSACLEFWYHMFGGGMGTLTLYTSTPSGRVAFWSLSGSQENAWKLARVTVSSPVQFNIVAEGVVGTNYQSDIAIDDILYKLGACPPIRTCTFEIDSCDWTQETSTDDFDWTRVQASAASHSSSQLVDKTTGTSNGYLMYLNPSLGQNQDRAIMYSGYYQPSAIGECLKFWYHMHGAGVGTLRVYTYINGALGPVLYEKSGDQDDVWRYVTVTLMNSTYEFRAAIEGTLGTGQTGDLVLDDVDIKVGPCNPPGFCDFESDMCGWVNEVAQDDFDFVRTRGADASSLAPPIDHTFSSDLGYYMLIETATIPSGRKAWLNSEHFSPTPIGASCFTFWLYMFGSGVGTMNVYVRDTASGTMQLLHTESGDRGNLWHEVSITVTSSAEYQVYLEGIEGSNATTSTMAVDDTRLANGACMIPTQFDCDFENDICNYTQASDDDFDWLRSSFSTPSIDTGPSIDHTTGTGAGFYVFLETSSPRVAGEKARLESALVPRTAENCLEFWYHMWGDDVDTLSVYARPDGAGIGAPIWTRVGTRDNQWYLGRVALTMATSYKYVFEGVVGTSYLSDIALDDIRVYAGPCEVPNLCEFEEPDLCGYTSDLTANFNWTWNADRTPTLLTGPSIDVSYGSANGHYMYTEATNQRPGDVARLISPPFVPEQSTRTACWRFYYHMFGDQMGTLRVKVNGDPTTLWSMSSNFGDQWFLGEVEYTSQTVYQMVFEGEIGSGDRSDMAIDQISKLAGPCPVQGSCDFERDTCTWINSQADVFDWVRLNSDTASQYTGPSSDHTCGVSGSCSPGFFLYIETSSPRVAGDYARLSSSFLTPNQDFCMTFWYHMYGADIGELFVLKTVSSLETVVWFLSGQQSSNSTDWKYGQIGVTDTIPFQMMFEGVVGKSFAGDIAIDDVLFLPGLCNAFPSTADPAQYGFNASCDFEASICSWQQARDDGFDWSRYQGSTPSVDTGPSGDHTTGSGYYIYTEASSPRVALERARITTRPLTPTSLLGNCLSFWYHMTGSTMGTLNLFMTSLANGTDTALWSKTGEQDGDWLPAQRTIRSDQDFTITFEGIIGSSYESDIALDDIVYTQGSCPPPRQCDFELDFCEWSQVATIDDFDWTRPRGIDIHPGQTGTRLPDKTTGTSTGHFVYLDETSQQAGNTAVLINPHFPAIPDGECLQFWYYVHGTGVGSLEVFQYFPNTTSLGARLWGKNGDQGDLWRLGRVTLQANSPFLAAFVGTVGSTGQGDVAIDDVEVTIGSCPLAGYCDFEDGFCSWTNEATLDDLDFVRGSGSTDSLETGPSFDHTKGTTDG